MDVKILEAERVLDTVRPHSDSTLLHTSPQHQEKHTLKYHANHPHADPIAV